MRIGIPLSTLGDFRTAIQEVPRFEAAGLDVVSVSEGYTFDAVSRLGFLAARTSRVTLASGILNIYSRTPTLLAMTAAGLDALSAGRFELGIGSSGPQVVEGFHGVRFDAPLGRTREVVEICRKVWRHEKVRHDGRHYHLPLTEAHGGSRLGRPLKILDRPVRARIPITLAAIGLRNVALAAEIADAWQPVCYLPEAAGDVFGEALAGGTARRDPGLDPLRVTVNTYLLISEDASDLARAAGTVRGRLALYLGGMGARDRNFYNELAVRYGFAAEARLIQDLYLAGRKAEAAGAVPEALLRGTALLGPAGFVKERVAALAQSGVTSLGVTPLAGTLDARLHDIARLKDFAS